ncbi:unnamed protein product [Protopolystoma xenopodis]|uniref:Uncharacterized protein n=1 Tax=Protopolystoma xenopodis TaxID=117903 RepID=A0A3S5B045_9PLAT|nr:unnamed protein product [Protopolystoma xenopodis]
MTWKKLAVPETPQGGAKVEHMFVLSAALPITKALSLFLLIYLSSQLAMLPSFSISTPRPLPIHDKSVIPLGLGS